MMKAPIFLLIFSVLFLFTCSENAHEKGYAITDVDVLPMDTEVILEDQTVLVKDDKILRVGSNKEVEIPKGFRVINGKDKFLMPGLTEMHAHIPVAREGNDSLVQETLFLYLSNGITTIRGMLGNPYHLKLKEQVQAGEILSPRIYTSGISMNGNSIPDAETAISKVKMQREAGYDFLKIHPGIQMGPFDAMIQTANEVGIKYAGHVPVMVGIEHALNSGYETVDHLDGYLEGLVPKEKGIDPNTNGFFGFNFIDEVDLAYMPSLAKLTKDKGVWVVPTQSLFVRWVSTMSPEERIKEPEMKYMARKTRDNWKKGAYSFQGGPNFNVENVEKFTQIRHAMLQELHKAGVGFLLGSDAPQVFNVPGFSIHHEMQSVVDAGIPIYDVLKSGTVNPAVFFGDEGKYGVVQEGASADLILINGNPLENLYNLREPEGVMVRGKWLSANEIAARLRLIEKRYE